jgi:EAL and modified HD-GYP domain-containing signal transduction protein
MGLHDFLDRMLGKPAETAGTGALLGMAPQASATSPSSPVQGQRASAEALLCREEVVDSRNRLYGYRFTLKPPAGLPMDNESALLGALATVGIPTFAQRRLAAIPIDERSVSAGAHLPLAAPHALFVLDLRAAALSTADWQSRLEAIRDSGSKAGIAGLGAVSDPLPILKNADVAFFNLSDYSFPHLEGLIRDLRQQTPTTALAAEGIQSWAERRLCGTWGFNYFLGPFLATQDEEEHEKGFDQSRIVVIELLNKLRADADAKELGDIAKRAPGIAFHLLSLANSPAAGLTQPVQSLEQAIMVLGRSMLYRWLVVSMFRVGQARERDETLLEIALTRARFMELVGQSSMPQSRCDELFLVGLISLFDLLFSIPLPRILQKISVSEDVRRVLLDSEGPYGRFLMLAIAVEKGRADQALKLASALGIDAETLGNTSQTALAWAETAMRP